MAEPTTTAAPPITIGEITDVPAPNSPINAQFHQEVANRITHRFATVAQMNAWAAANGSIAFSTDTGLFYGRSGGIWRRLSAGLLTRVYATAGQQCPPNTAIELARVTFNADPSRWYRTTVAVPTMYTAQSTTGIKVAIWDAATTIIREHTATMSGAETYDECSFAVDESGLSGAGFVRRLVITNESTSATLSLFRLGEQSAAFRAPSIAVEDLGAV